MSLKLGFKKWYLQFLQVKAVKNGSNISRYEEQLEVLKKLSYYPNILFTDKYLEENTNHAKYINVITSKALDKKKYQRTKRYLKECLRA